MHTAGLQERESKSDIHKGERKRMVWKQKRNSALLKIGSWERSEMEGTL